MSDSIALVITTYRDLFGWLCKERGQEEEYRERSAAVWMSAADLEALGLKEEDRVELASTAGRVVLQAQLDEELPQGMGYIPTGPYASRLVDYDPARSKLPNFKRIEVAARATSEDITTIPVP